MRFYLRCVVYIAKIWKRGMAGILGSRAAGNIFPSEKDPLDLPCSLIGFMPGDKAVWRKGFFGWISDVGKENITRANF